MLHTSNTASIKLNSNVVTEFPRSKKLMKFPRVAMTGASAPTGYVASASSNYEDGTNSYYQLWKPFDGSIANDFGAWLSDNSPVTYSTSSPYNATSATGNSLSGITGGVGSRDGAWLKLELPHKIKLSEARLYGRNAANTERIDAGYIYGSIDDTNWTQIGEISVSGISSGNLSTYTDIVPLVILSTDTTNYYKYFIVQPTSLTHASGFAGIGQMEYYGTPEYDPEAHGTDVTVKSYPNVPNTDWLEVYYDAKNYSGSGDVQDETTNSRDAEMNATFDNGEIKAFNFSGAYTSNVTTSDHGLGTGDVTYTMSYWFKRTAVAGSYDYVVMLGNGGTGNSSILMWINNNQLVLDHWSASLRVVEPIVLNKWYHVAAGHRGGVTPSFTNDFVYINGTQVTNFAALTQTAAPFTLAGSKLTLGSEHNGTTEFLNGSIANFRLFNRALTSDEIYQLYAYQKEDFGHGDLSITLKAGRLGIGTSEPRADLDVRGDTFSTLYKGGRTTFLTWDYVGQRYVDIAAIANATSYANVANVLDHTFDIPSCYHSLGTANLKAFVQIDWRGEVHWPWNFGFRIEVTYNGTQIAYSSSSDHAASWNSRVCGVVSDSYHNDYYSTPDFASVTSQYTLNNCDVSPGSTLKVQLVGQHGDTAGSNRVWTGRTNGNHNQADYELPITSFFVVLDVDDGY